MSLISPNVFVVVGDTDGWSTSIKNPELVVDSRMRGLIHQYGAATWKSAFSQQSRDSRKGKYYAELTVVETAGSANMFGVTAVGSENLGTYYPGMTGVVSVGLTNNQIFQAAIAVQAVAAPTNVVGANIGLAIYFDTAVGVNRVQFYYAGTAVGTPVSVTGTLFRLTGAHSLVGNHSILAVDRDDLRYLPDDCQPWGCSARVSDCGGYSPTASKLVAAAVTSTIDVQGRGLVAGASNRGARTGVIKANAELIHFEIELEVMPTAGQAVGFGLTTLTAGLTTTPGLTAGCIGFYWTAGANANKRYNGGAAVAVVGAGTWVVGMRHGLLWNPSTGDVWATRNGVPWEGSPSTGTGASYNIGVNAQVVPLVYTGTNGRIRLYTHKRELKYPIPQAVGFEQSDIMPEQHFTGLVAADTEITQGVWFQFPWGGNASKGSTIGAIEIFNSHGFYDRLISYMLRDQDLSIYETLPNGVVDYVAKANVDFCETQGEDIIRVLTRGKDSIFDVNLPAGFGVGLCNLVPTVPDRLVADRYFVNSKGAINAFAAFQNYDRGVNVNATTAVFSAAPYFGFGRTVGSATSDHRITMQFTPNNFNDLVLSDFFSYIGFTNFENNIYSFGATFCGFFYSEPVLQSRVIRDLLNTAVADYYEDKVGKMIILELQQVPAAVGSATYEVYEADTAGDTTYSDDKAPNLTNGLTVYVNQRKFEVSELAGGTTVSNRHYFSQDYEEQRDASVVYHSFYQHGYSNAPLSTGYSNNVVSFFDTIGFSNVQSQYAKKMGFVEKEVSLEVIRYANPLDAVDLYLDRYADSKPSRLIKKVRRLLSPYVRCLFWIPS